MSQFLSVLFREASIQPFLHTYIHTYIHKNTDIMWAIEKTDKETDKDYLSCVDR